MTVTLDLKARGGPLPVDSGAAPARPDAEPPTLRDAARSKVEHAMKRATYPLYIVANVAPRVAMLVLIMVFTRILPVQEFGLFALVVTMGEILDMTASNWVRVYILRTEAGAGKLSSRRLGRALSLSWGATLLSLVIAAVTVPMVSDVRDGDLVLGTIAYIVAFSLARLTLTFAQLTQRHAVYAAIEGARAVGIVVATAIVAFTHIRSFLPASLILSLMTGSICAASLLNTLRGLPKPRLSRSGYLAAIDFGLPFMLASLLTYTLGWFDRFIINFFAGPSSVAVYVAAFAIARQPVELLISPLNNYIFPILVRAYATGDSGDARTMQSGVLTAVIAISAATVAGLSLLAEPLATLFFPVNYRASVATLIPLVAAGTLFLMLKQFVFDNSFHITRRTWLHLATMVPPALISVALGIVLIRLYGDVGAAITYVVSTLIALCTSAAASLRIFSFAIPWRQVAGIAIATATASVLTWIVMTFVVPLGLVVEIGTVGITFSMLYAAVLLLMRISIRQLLEMPWVPGR
jgi:O-antigen/teichoic acid export membrane protein